MWYGRTDVGKDRILKGGDVDPEAIKDKPGQYDRNVVKYGEPPRKGRVGRSTLNPSLARRNTTETSNRNPGHVIVTDFPRHSAKEVCEHPNSVGWDIASIWERLFCDLSERKLYPLCTTDITADCFDSETKMLKTVIKRGLSSMISARSYDTSAHWKLLATSNTSAGKPAA